MTHEKKKLPELSDIALYVLIGIAGTILLILIIQTNLQGSNEIFTDNIYSDFFEGDVKLVNQIRTEYVQPNDPLRFEIFFSTKNEDPVEIACYLEIKQGEKILKEYSIGGFELKNDGSRKGVTMPIFLDEIGSHIVTIHIVMKNKPTIENYGGPTQWQHPYIVDITSPTDVIQKQTIDLQKQNLYITGSIGAATIVALLASILISKKTAEIQRDHKELVAALGNKEQELLTAEQKRNTLFRVFEMLNESNNRRMRKKIFDEYCRHKFRSLKIKNPTPFLPRDELRQTSDAVISPFDQINILINENLLETELFMSLYAEMVIRVWKVLEPYVQEQREISPKFGIGFEEMNQKATNFLISKKTEIPEPYCDPDIDPYGPILDE